MKQAARQIAAFTVILILFCIICRLTIMRDYTVYIRAGASGELRMEDFQVEAEGEEDAVRLENPSAHGGYLRYRVKPNRAGKAGIRILDRSDASVSYQMFRVTPLHTVYDQSTGGFTGDSAVLIAVTLFWLLTGLIMIWHYSQAKGPDFYSYATIYYAGFSLFAIANFVLMAVVTARHLLHPETYIMLTAYRYIQGASSQFMMLTAPLVLCFAVLMAVSNIALLRHQTPRVQNLLGLLFSFLLVAGEAAGFFLLSRDFSGSEMAGRVQTTLKNVYTTTFVYFECMLIGSVICGSRAARHEPDPEKDFIVILGCWFRKDGTLPPLLRGRVDRAISFWRKQREMTGKEAILIPSGGQGANESMPEAEAMRRYLVSQGIPEEKIRMEDQSRNTWQNMDYSRKIIQEINPQGKPVFATSNYHVFRSGIWAAEAGLKMEGMGSKTVWWYWPNAFMRECAGLLQKRWKQEILLMVILIAFFGLLSMILG